MHFYKNSKQILAKCFSQTIHSMFSFLRKSYENLSFEFFFSWLFMIFHDAHVFFPILNFLQWMMILKTKLKCFMVNLEIFHDAFKKIEDAIYDDDLSDLMIFYDIFMINKNIIKPPKHCKLSRNWL